MFNLIDKWLKKTPEEEIDDTVAQINAKRAMSRRGFISGLVGGFVGISTGVILPSKKILITMGEMPGFNDRAYLRPLQQPLFSSEMFDFYEANCSTVTFFQRVPKFKKDGNPKVFCG